jgi:hypothetical protein
MVPWNNSPCDEILDKLLPHNHIGYVWLILFLGTFHTWHYLLIPVWKSVLLGDSILWVVLPPTIAGVCSSLTAPLFCWQRVPVWVTLPIWVHLRKPSVSCDLQLSNPWLLFCQLPWRCHKLVQACEQSSRSRFGQLICQFILSLPSWPGTHISCTVMFGHLHEGFVAAPNQFWGDRVVAQSFNRGLAIWKNVDVPVPIVPI